jgi:SAM-dependent methyltransferase
VPEPAAKRDEYLLGHSADEHERLRRQPQELAADSAHLLDQLNIRPGDRAIDIGCGPQGILDLLSERVGVDGKVIGLERSESTLQLAREFVAERKLRNVELLWGDAKATGMPKASFDLVHARLVLVNLPEPQSVLEEMVALARPGGVVASHEADWGAFACDPPSAAYDRMVETFEQYSRSNGIDLFIGRKIPRMLRAAGLTDIHVHPIIHVYPPGHGRRFILCDFFRNVRDRLLAAGLIDENQFRDWMSESKRHLDDANTVVISHLFVQAWGHKPG